MNHFCRHPWLCSTPEYNRKPKITPCDELAQELDDSCVVLSLLPFRLICRKWGTPMHWIVGLKFLKLTLDVGNVASVCFQQLLTGELLFFSLSKKRNSASKLVVGAGNNNYCLLDCEI